MMDKLSERVHYLAFDADPKCFLPGDVNVHKLADEVAALEQRVEERDIVPALFPAAEEKARDRLETTPTRRTP